MYFLGLILHCSGTHPRHCIAANKEMHFICYEIPKNVFYSISG